MGAPLAVIAGSVTFDTVRARGRTVRKIGGVPAYAGLAFRRLGIDVTALSNFAAADRPRFRALEAAGVRLVAGDSPGTTRFVNAETAAGREQEMPSAAAPVRHGAEWLSDPRAALVHLGPLHPRDIHPDLLEAARRLRVKKSLDIQGWVRRVGPSGRVEPGVTDADGLALALSAADIIKGDGREIRLMEEAFAAPLVRLLDRFGVENALVTDGPRGGRLVSSGGRETGYTPLPRVECGDATGAGDVFFAVYLAQRLFMRTPEQEALDAAAAAAASHVAGRFLDPAHLLLSEAEKPDS